VSNITSAISGGTVVFLEDPNGYIQEYFKNKIGWEISKQNNLNSAEISHAIVFDDGEEFPSEYSYLESKKIPLRRIEISITRVVNIKKETEYQNIKSTPKYEYIGRGSYWGNPYSMYEAGDDREEVIRKYKYDFDYEKFPNKEKSEVYKLAGKRLGCFCKPSSCHGDILADYLNSWDDGK
jgi:hypothetical protein